MGKVSPARVSPPPASLTESAGGQPEAAALLVVSLLQALRPARTLAA